MTNTRKEGNSKNFEILMIYIKSNYFFLLPKFIPRNKIDLYKYIQLIFDFLLFLIKGRKENKNFFVIKIAV